MKRLIYNHITRSFCVENATKEEVESYKSNTNPSVYHAIEIIKQPRYIKIHNAEFKMDEIVGTAMLIEDNLNDFEMDLSKQILYDTLLDIRELIKSKYIQYM